MDGKRKYDGWFIVTPDGEKMPLTMENVKKVLGE